MDGIQIARLLQRTYQIPVIFLTTHNDEATIIVGPCSFAGS
jgi:CheY-like chemotaxis protein